MSLSWRKTNSDLAISESMIQYYRNVFSSPEGKAVLTHMLYELHYFNDCVDNQEKISRRNYATRLLKILGGFNGNKAPGVMVDAMAKTLFKIDLPKDIKDAESS